MSERARERERERDVGIICVKIYDDLALEAWTQRGERERTREIVCLCVSECVWVVVRVGVCLQSEDSNNVR